VREWLTRYAERWRVLVPFLALGIAMAVALWLVVAVIHANQARIREGRVRDREACRRQHFTVQMFRLFLIEGSRQFERRPVRGDGRELRAFRRRATVLLRRADCRTVMR
jgi:hypothetical protein